MWARRAILVTFLAGAAVIPVHRAAAPPSCHQRRCAAEGSVRWTRPLPGSWVTGRAAGTVLAAGAAYAAAGPDVAVVGSGLTVRGYELRSGRLLWTAGLAVLRALGAGSAIVSVRAWPGVVTAGVSGAAATAGPASRSEVVLSARTGAVIRSFPAAQYGGAAAADAGSTVIVGASSVTRYDNVTGHRSWSRPTGPVAQAWRRSDGELYVTVAAGGYLGTAPVTALRRINVQTGAEEIVRPPGGRFAGTLSGAAAGAVFFSGAAGLTAYNGSTGEQLWQQAGAVPETVDTAAQALYVNQGGVLTGISPLTGARLKNASIKGASAFYQVRDGVALGLDQGALGDAYGYSMPRHRVVWMIPGLPWPHYFVDLSGIGGSEDLANDTVLLAICAQLGSTGPAPAAGQPCSRPQLVALRR